MPPKTRKPTGKTPWPFIVYGGEDKSGKGVELARLSRSPRLGQMYWMDLGEGAADEYIVMPGTSWEILEHDGTFASIYEQVRAVHAEADRVASAGQPPVVLVIDSMSTFWSMLSLWATNRAGRSRKNREILARDPDAEIDVTSNYWNDANDRHKKIVDLLISMRGVVVVTARLKQVSVMGPNGQPTPEKTWKVEGQKYLPYDSTVTIHQYRNPRRAEIVGIRSLKVRMADGDSIPLEITDVFDAPADDAGMLEHVIFDVLGCSIEESSGGRQVERLSENIVDRFLQDIAVTGDKEGLQVIWEMAKDATPPGDARTAISVAVQDRLKAIQTQPEETLPVPDKQPTVQDDASARIRAAAAETPAEPVAEESPDHQRLAEQGYTEEDIDRVPDAEPPFDENDPSTWPEPDEPGTPAAQEKVAARRQQKAKATA